MDVQEPDFDDEYWQREYTKTRYKTCSRCGAGKLHWEDISLIQEVEFNKSKWRLFEEDGEIHICGVDKGAKS